MLKIFISPQAVGYTQGMLTSAEHIAHRMEGRDV